MEIRRPVLGMLAAVAALFALLLAAPAGAQEGDGDYPPAGEVVTVSPSEVQAGGSVTVAVSGFSPGDVAVAFNPALGTITAGPAGAGSGSFTIPADTAAGDYTLTATQGDLVASTALTVTAAGAADGEDLPVTGSDSSLPLAQTGVAAVAAGGLMVVVANRRRKAAA